MNELTLDQRLDLFLKGMQEFKERQEKSHEEFEKRIEKEEEQRKKDYEQFKERQKKIDSKLESLGFSCGINAETFFIEGTEEGLTIDGHTFKQDFFNYDVRIGQGRKERILTEIDLILSNDDIVFLIEIKYRIDTQHYQECERRFNIFKEYKKSYIDGRKLYKGIASLGVKKEMKEFYKENGYFVLTQKGEDIKVHKPILNVVRQSLRM